MQDYATYVKILRDNLAKGMKMPDAVNVAVDEAIKLGLLGDFFKVHRAEVLMNLLTEFDQEKYDRCRRREGYEDGIHDKAVETARKMLSDGLSVDMIVKYIGLPLSEVTALQAELSDVKY